MPTESTMPGFGIGARSLTSWMETGFPEAVRACSTSPRSSRLRRSGASGCRSTISSPASRPGRALPSSWNVTSFMSSGLPLPVLALEMRRDLLHKAVHLLLHQAVRLVADVEVEDHLGDAAG